MTDTKPILLYIKITEPTGDDIERAKKILALWRENFDVVEVQGGDSNETKTS